MRIAVNARVFDQHDTGVRRFLSNTLRELGAIDEQNTYFILTRKKLDIQMPRNFHNILLRAKSRLAFDYMSLPLFCRRKSIELTILPKGTFPPYLPGKRLTVIHDLLVLEKNFASDYSLKEQYHHKTMLAMSMRKADHIVAVSQFTKNRLKKLVNPDTPITVAHEGVAQQYYEEIQDELRRAVLKKYSIQRPFIFYCGTRSPRKNLFRILKAFQNVKDQLRHEFIIAGSNVGSTKELDFLVRDMQKSRLRLLGHISEEDLRVLYKLADLFVFPSTYEGFGLPIIEAQASGCPVLTSDANSCREIAGDGACLVDPLSIESIQAGMSAVLEDPVYKEKLLKRGRKNAEKFNWNRTAQVFHKVIQGMAQ